MSPEADTRFFRGHVRGIPAPDACFSRICGGERPSRLRKLYIIYNFPARAVLPVAGV